MRHRTRELIKYLSLIPSPFERDFVLDIGDTAQIEDPGHAFDILIGPWIESHGNNIYSISPLLRGYATNSMGKNMLEKYQLTLCLAWLKKRKLTPIEFNQAMLTALHAKFDPLIGKLCNIIFTTSDEDFGNIAKDLFIIPHLFIESRAQLTGIHPLTRFMFRYFQLKVTDSNEDWNSYLKIYLQIQKEINELEKDSLEFKMCLWLFYIESIIRLDTPIPANIRISQAIMLIDMVKKNKLTEIISGIYAGENELDNLLMFATHHITTYQDLEMLISQLENSSKEIILSFFKGFEGFPDNLSLMIDKVWLDESKKDIPNWDKCIEVFSKTMKFANQHHNEWLLAGAARGIMVIYDEYMGEKDKAIETGEKARSFLKKSNSLIDLQEATIQFRSHQYNKVIDLVSNVVSLLNTDIPIIKIHALNRAIISAGMLKQWDKIEYFAECGQKISQFFQLDDYKELYLIGFEAELGWCKFEKENYNEAYELFKSVLKKMEAFPNQNYPNFQLFHLKFTYCLGWLSQFFKIDGVVTHFKPNLSRPSAGTFTDVYDPSEEVKTLRRQDYPLLWAHLAKYAASFANIESIDLLSKHALTREDDKKYILALIEMSDAIFLNSLFNLDFDRAIKSGLVYSKVMANLTKLRTDINENDYFIKPVDVNSFYQNLDENFYITWAEGIFGFILEPMAMQIFSMNDKPNLNFSMYTEIFLNNFEHGHKALKYLDWFKIVVEATFSDDNSIDIVKKDALDTSENSDQTKRLSILSMCVSSSIQPALCLSFQYMMLKNMTLPTMEHSVWAILFYNLIKKRWSYFANNQKFQMVSPSIWSETILNALSASSPKPSEVAKILLLIGEATATRWPSEIFSELNQLSQL